MQPPAPPDDVARDRSVLVVDHREIYAASLAVAVEPVAPRGSWGTTWEAVIAQARATTPDLLLINPFFEDADHDASDVIDQVSSPGQVPVVLCWTTVASPTARDMAESLGAAGYIHLRLDSSLLREAAAVALEGGAWFAEVPGRHPDFTDEELLVLALLTKSRDLAGLESGLHGRAGTAETWLAKLYAKLGASTPDGLVEQATEAGLYDLSSLPRKVRRAPPTPGAKPAT